MYELQDVHLWTSQGSKVVHVSSHAQEPGQEPHILCQGKAGRLVMPTPRQLRSRTLCWACKQLIEERARVVTGR